jgi:hypothetical protein
MLAFFRIQLGQLCSDIRYSLTKFFAIHDPLFLNSLRLNRPKITC